MHLNFLPQYPTFLQLPYVNLKVQAQPLEDSMANQSQNLYPA